MLEIQECAQKNSVIKCSMFFQIAHQVPSGYFLADSFLYLDLLLNKKLFKPSKGKDKEKNLSRSDMAGLEGSKAKKMLQSLRFLWRSSKEGGHDPRIVDLKQYVRASPRKVPHHAAH